MRSNSSADHGDHAEAAARGHQAYAARDYPTAVAAFDEAIAARAAAPLPEDPDLIATRAHCLLALGRSDEAFADYTRALELAGATGDPGARAAANTGLGFVAQRRGDYAAAASAFEAALADELARGDALGAARARQSLGGAWYMAGDYLAAHRAWTETVSAFRERGRTSELVALLVNLGGMEYGLQQIPDAIGRLDEAAALFPAAWEGSALEARLRGNRGLALLALGRFEEGQADLERGSALYDSQGEVRRAAHLTATLSNLWRYRGDLDQAVELHRQVMAAELEHGFLVDDPGVLLYSALEDHALHGEVALEAAERVASGGRQLPGADVEATVSSATAHRDELGQRPFVIFAPPCPGLRGPLFPRGATAVASYLNAHGVPAVVVPLSHYVDLYLGVETARQRLHDVVVDAVSSLRPRAVGISVTFSFLFPLGIQIAEAAREASPDVPIVIGGPHVTYQDRECLEQVPEIDVVVRGEGEWTALELAHALEAGRGADLSAIHGITWRAADGRVHKNRLRPLGDVLELPPVDFHLLPPAFATRMEVSGISSRGCTFRCAYCHEFRFWGGKVRQYPAERVVDEMERLGREHDNPMAGIDDSMLSMHEPYFVRLCEALGASEWLPTRFGFLTRVDTITTEGLEAMNRAGLDWISVGLESGSENVLKSMNKGITVAQAEAGLTLARDYGVHVSGFFIVGHPGDNPVESQTTIDWVDGLFQQDLIRQIDAATFIPYPGTPFFIHPEKYGVDILTMEWSRWRRDSRPVAQLANYSASAIYLGYLRMLQVMARHRPGAFPIEKNHRLGREARWRGRPALSSTTA